MRILALALALASAGCVSMVLGFSPLQKASYDGDEARVDALIAQGSAPGRVESNDADAIGVAIGRHPELARRLLARCVDGSAANRCPMALEDAALMGDEASARKLLAKGADLDGILADLQLKDAKMRQALGSPDGGMLAKSVADSPEMQAAMKIRSDGIALLQRLRSEREQAAAAKTSAESAPAPEASKPWWK